ncbi:opsin, ultraviolet-sensitive-like [Onthophagus taurus]|uniref:opsin, ultraviolet-sensitive-like n=1 Tax=Onthophagus taurus TaxID=166361 RepID=UPI0039BE6E36
MLLMNSIKNNSNSTSINNENALQRFNATYPVDDWLKCCFLTVDYINEMNPHWMQFEPPPRIVYYILAGVYLVVMIIGVFGNLTVIGIFYRCAALRTPANTLIMNLAFSDLLMMAMIPLLLYNCFNYGPAIGRTGCKLYGFMGGLSGTVSICLLAAISYDRFYVIRFPLRKLINKAHIYPLVGLSWIYGIVFSIIPVLDLGFGSYVPEAYFISCSFDYITPRFDIKIFILSYFVAAWLVPFIIITFSYVNIIWVVARSRKVITKNLSTKETYIHMKKEVKLKQEMKLAVTVLLVVLLWFVAWTPYATVALLGISGESELITPAVSLAPALFCKMASCLDPYVYAFSHPKIRKEIDFMLSQNSATRFFCPRRVLERRFTQRMSERMSQSIEAIEEVVMVTLPSEEAPTPHISHHI